MKFTEAKLEQAFIELLAQEGYKHQPGEELKRNSDEVIIEDDLRNFLQKQYQAEGITQNEISSIILQLKSLPASELYESNRQFIRMLSDGFILKREDRSQKDIYIQLIDYTGLSQHRTPQPHELIEVSDKETNIAYTDNNSYKFVTQLEIVGTEKRIPDGIIYINGLPLVVFEFKSAIREEVSIHDAYEQLTVRYRRGIPQLFIYNTICVISDGVNNRAGSFFASYEFYYAWRRIEGHHNDVDGISSMKTLVQGMLDKSRLRDIIRNFIFIPDNSKHELKIVCRYPQYYAARALFNNIITAQKPSGDGKGGTYFGATGSGKSYIMLYLTRLLMKSQHFASPTIVLITDRTDLDTQLSEQFVNAKGFIGDNLVESVESRANLREKLQGRQSGGVFLTTIHKFTEDTRLLTKRTNVICISDEAHRSQVNLEQRVRVTQDGVTKTYGFAKHLHNSLPNATFVGFTGTPIDATLDVFGKVIDSYTMKESVKDKITVPIVYEGRAAKVVLKNSELEKIEKYYEEMEQLGANEHQIEQSKKEMANMYAVLGDPDRLQAVAEDFVNHYEQRLQEGSTVLGKAMFVSSNRQIAYELYKKIINHLGSRSSSLGRRSSSFEVDINTNYAQYFTKQFGYPSEWHGSKLPHRNKEGLVQFITFRLADSLPQEVLKEIEEEIKHLSQDSKDLEKRKKYQYWLDKGLGSCALANREMAQVVQEALMHHDGEKYNLLAWSIMPNHVHVLIHTKSDLPTIVQSWKSYTGKWALKNNSTYNLGLEQNATRFWMPNYWDRFIRNEEHFNNTVRYILDNPAKANLPTNHNAYLFRGCNLSDEMKRTLHPTQIKLVMTRNENDEKELWDMLGSPAYRKELDKQFKDPKSNFKIAIVVDMWLTGFDVPFLDTMYIDKPIQQHNLIQTISRVNRRFKGKEKGLVVDYIGIKKHMNLALAMYNAGDREHFEDIEQSLVIVKDHLDLLAKLMHGFDSSKYFNGSSLEQLHTLNMATEYIQQSSHMETRFMGLVKRLKAAYDICTGSEKLTQKDRDDTHFYLAIRSIIVKLTKGDAPDTEQMNAKVREMVKDALQSDGVEEVFKLGDDAEAQQDIFDKDYLEKIDRIKLPNTKIKLLQQLLAKAIADIKKVNRIKGIDFTKKMQAVVERYNDRSANDKLISEVYEEIAETLTNLIMDVQREFTAGEKLGIDFEEKAFYDILKELCIKYDFTYPEDRLIELSREVKKIVDKQSKYPDWNKREDIKSALKVDLILILDKYGYPPVERDEVYVEIFEQAENFKKNQQ